jgi:small subunit ribosomal protein S16
MLMIRLQRVGRKHEPVFRLVLTDSKNGPKSGKFLEILGSYDARRGEKAEFDTEKVKYWMGKGAQLSATINNLLLKRKVITGQKVNVLSKRFPTVSTEAKVTNEAEKTEVPADSAEVSEGPKEVAPEKVS